MKQRLVGAIVLVALAVIFLPMMLDGSGRSGPREIAIEIPAKPEPPANRLETTLDFSDTAVPPRAPDEAATAALAEPASADAPDAPRPPAGDEREASGAADVVPTVASEGGSSAPADRAQAAAGDASAESGDGGGTAGPTAWVVQVGSFVRETNALVLRDRLRAADFDAFAERADSGGRTVWRVRIGPVASRDAADRLSERVMEERDGPVLVMTHP